MLGGIQPLGSGMMGAIQNVLMEKSIDINSIK
jgi:hypothetical protein